MSFPSLRILYALIGLVLLTTSTTSVALDPRYAELEEQVKAAIDRKNHNAFEKLVLEWQPVDGVLPRCRDGQARLSAIHGIVQNYRFTVPTKYKRFQAMLDAWHTAKPDSPHWRIYAAYHLCRKADEEAKDAASVKIWEEAVQMLDESEKMIGRAPDWYSSFFATAWTAMKLVKAGSLLSLPDRFENWISTAEEGIRKYPGYERIWFETDHLAILTRYPGGLDAWTRHICELQPELGLQPYAKIWWSQEFAFNGRLFRKGNADWPTFKKGFYEMLERYPQSKRLPAKFLEFARLAGDRETANKLLPLIDNPPGPETFPITVRFLEIQRWAAGTAVERKPIWKHNPAPASSVAWSKDGEWVFTGFRTWYVHILNAADGTHVRRIFLEDKESYPTIWDIALSPDGKRVAAVDGGLHEPTAGKCRVWDLETFEPTATFTNKAGPLFSLSWSPDNNRLIATGGPVDGPGEAWLWDGDSASGMKFEQTARISIQAVGWDPSGQKLLFNSISGRIIVAEPKKQLREVKQIAIKGATSILDLRFSPDGKWVAAASGGSYYDNTKANGSITVFNAETMEPRVDANPPRVQGLRSLDWSPDGKLIACGGYDGYIYLLDSQNCELKDFWSIEGGFVSKVRWSPDGTKLAVAGSNGITIWQVK